MLSYMSTYSIPKKKAELKVKKLQPGSREFQQLHRDFHNNIYAVGALSKSYSVTELYEVYNPTIEAKYNRLRKAWKERGYSDDMTSDTLGFLNIDSFSILQVTDILKTGVQAGNLDESVLCDPSLGVQLSRHSDVTDEAPLRESQRTLLVFKLMKGRLKNVDEQPEHLSNLKREPQLGFDTFASQQFKSQYMYLSKMFYIYHFESESDITPCKVPPQICPIAFITFQHTLTQLPAASCSSNFKVDHLLDYIETGVLPKERTATEVRKHSARKVSRHPVPGPTRTQHTTPVTASTSSEDLTRRQSEDRSESETRPQFKPEEPYEPTDDVRDRPTFMYLDKECAKWRDLCEAFQSDISEDSQYFTVTEMHYINSHKLLEKYNAIKDRWSKVGYTPEQLCDRHGYLDVTDFSVKELGEICSKGLQLGNFDDSVIADFKQGVQLFQYPDKLNKHKEMAYEKVLLMFRYMPGRQEALPETYQTSDLPSPNNDYDSFVSERRLHPTSGWLSSLIYLHSYSEEQKCNIVPSHVYPVAFVRIMFRKGLRFKATPVAGPNIYLLQQCMKPKDMRERRKRVIKLNRQTGDRVLAKTQLTASNCHPTPAMFTPDSLRGSKRVKGSISFMAHSEQTLPNPSVKPSVTPSNSNTSLISTTSEDSSSKSFMTSSKVLNFKSLLQRAMVPKSPSPVTDGAKLSNPSTVKESPDSPEPQEESVPPVESSPQIEKVPIEDNTVPLLSFKTETRASPTNLNIESDEDSDVNLHVPQLSYRRSNRISSDSYTESESESPTRLPRRRSSRIIDSDESEVEEGGQKPKRRRRGFLHRRSAARMHTVGYTSDTSAMLMAIVHKPVIQEYESMDMSENIVPETGTNRHPLLTDCFVLLQQLDYRITNKAKRTTNVVNKTLQIEPIIFGKEVWNSSAISDGLSVMRPEKVYGRRPLSSPGESSVVKKKPKVAPDVQHEDNTEQNRNFTVRKDVAEPKNKNVYEEVDIFASVRNTEKVQPLKRKKKSVPSTSKLATADTHPAAKPFLKASQEKSKLVTKKIVHFNLEKNTQHTWEVVSDDESVLKHVTQDDVMAEAGPLKKQKIVTDVLNLSSPTSPSIIDAEKLKPYFDSAKGFMRLPSLPFFDESKPGSGFPGPSSKETNSTKTSSDCPTGSVAPMPEALLKPPSPLKPINSSVVQPSMDTALKLTTASSSSLNTNTFSVTPNVVDINVNVCQVLKQSGISQVVEKPTVSIVSDREQRTSQIAAELTKLIDNVRTLNPIKETAEHMPISPIQNVNILSHHTKVAVRPVDCEPKINTLDKMEKKMHAETSNSVSADQGTDSVSSCKPFLTSGPKGPNNTLTSTESLPGVSGLTSLSLSRNNVAANNAKKSEEVPNDLPGQPVVLPSVETTTNLNTQIQVDMELDTPPSSPAPIAVVPPEESIADQSLESPKLQIDLDASGSSATNKNDYPSSDIKNIFIQPEKVDSYPLGAHSVLLGTKSQLENELSSPKNTDIKTLGLSVIDKLNKKVNKTNLSILPKSLVNSTKAKTSSSSLLMTVGFKPLDSKVSHTSERPSLIGIPSNVSPKGASGHDSSATKKDSGPNRTKSIKDSLPSPTTALARNIYSNNSRQSDVLLQAPESKGAFTESHSDVIAPTVSKSQGKADRMAPKQKATIQALNSITQKSVLPTSLVVQKESRGNSLFTVTKSHSNTKAPTVEKEVGKTESHGSISAMNTSEGATNVKPSSSNISLDLSQLRGRKLPRSLVMGVTDNRLRMEDTNSKSGIELQSSVAKKSTWLDDSSEDLTMNRAPDTPRSDNHQPGHGEKNGIQSILLTVAEKQAASMNQWQAALVKKSSEEQKSLRECVLFLAKRLDQKFLDDPHGYQDPFIDDVVEKEHVSSLTSRLFNRKVINTCGPLASLSVTFQLDYEIMEGKKDWIHWETCPYSLCAPRAMQCSCVTATFSQDQQSRDMRDGGCSPGLEDPVEMDTVRLAVSHSQTDDSVEHIVNLTACHSLYNHVPRQLVDRLDSKMSDRKDAIDMDVDLDVSKLKIKFQPDLTGKLTVMDTIGPAEIAKEDIVDQNTTSSTKPDELEPRPFEGRDQHLAGELLRQSIIETGKDLERDSSKYPDANSGQYLQDKKPEGTFTDSCCTSNQAGKGMEACVPDKSQQCHFAQQKTGLISDSSLNNQTIKANQNTVSTDNIPSNGAHGSMRDEHLSGQEKLSSKQIQAGKSLNIKEILNKIKSVGKVGIESTNTPTLFSQCKGLVDGETDNHTLSEHKGLHNKSTFAAVVNPAQVAQMEVTPPSSFTPDFEASHTCFSTETQETVASMNQKNIAREVTDEAQLHDSDQVDSDTISIEGADGHSSHLHEHTACVDNISLSYGGTPYLNHDASRLDDGTTCVTDNTIQHARDLAGSNNGNTQQNNKTSHSADATVHPSDDITYVHDTVHSGDEIVQIANDTTHAHVAATLDHGTSLSGDGIALLDDDSACLYDDIFQSGDDTPCSTDEATRLNDDSTCLYDDMFQSGDNSAHLVNGTPCSTDDGARINDDISHSEGSTPVPSEVRLGGGTSHVRDLTISIHDKTTLNDDTSHSGDYVSPSGDDSSCLNGNTPHLGDSTNQLGDDTFQSGDDTTHLGNSTSCSGGDTVCLNQDAHCSGDNTSRSGGDIANLNVTTCTDSQSFHAHDPMFSMFNSNASISNDVDWKKGMSQKVSGDSLLASRKTDGQATEQFQPESEPQKSVELQKDDHMLHRESPVAISQTKSSEKPQSIEMPQVNTVSPSKKDLVQQWVSLNDHLETYRGRSIISYQHDFDSGTEETVDNDNKQVYATKLRKTGTQRSKFCTPGPQTNSMFTQSYTHEWHTPPSTVLQPSKLSCFQQVDSSTETSTRGPTKNVWKRLAPVENVKTEQFADQSEFLKTNCLVHSENLDEISQAKLTGEGMAHRKAAFPLQKDTAQQRACLSNPVAHSGRSVMSYQHSFDSDTEEMVDNSKECIDSKKFTLQKTVTQKLKEFRAAEPQAVNIYTQPSTPEYPSTTSNVLQPPKIPYSEQSVSNRESIWKRLAPAEEPEQPNITPMVLDLATKVKIGQVSFNEAVRSLANSQTCPPAKRAKIVDRLGQKVEPPTPKLEDRFQSRSGDVTRLSSGQLRSKTEEGSGDYFQVATPDLRGDSVCQERKVPYPEDHSFQGWEETDRKITTYSSSRSGPNRSRSRKSDYSKGRGNPHLQQNQRRYQPTTRNVRNSSQDITVELPVSGSHINRTHRNTYKSASSRHTNY